MTEGIRVVGLTGGIGTGKSTAAAILKEKGFAHIDADEIGREITADGSSMLPVLDELFGPSGAYGKDGMRILDDGGRLDRKALAAIVFTDAKKKAKLDEVMFREIIARIDQRISEIRENAERKSAIGEDSERKSALGEDSERKSALGEDVAEGGFEGNAADSDVTGILLDAPLLFEAGLDSRCDIVVLLVADEEIRIKRVCQRDGATEEEVRNRINSQMSDDDKRKKSDVIVENSGTIEDLERNLEKFFKKYSKNSCIRFNTVLL